jgi:FkbM family methyltransferase
MINLKQISERLNTKHKIICEVGVGGTLMVSQVKDLIPNAIKVILIEANPHFYKQLYEEVRHLENVKSYNYAVFNKNLEKVKLYNRNASTFIDGINSPSIVNDNYIPNDKDAFFIESKTFDFFDEGDIEILAADIEGAEWHILEYLRSRPEIICLETHGLWHIRHKYMNPNLEKINNWMTENNYAKYDSDTSDTVYILKNKL